MLRNESDAGARKVLCDYVGDAAATIQCLDDDRKKVCGPQAYEWNELMETLWGLLNSGEPTLMESAFKVMSVLFVHCGPNYTAYKEELAVVFKQALVHSNVIVNVSGMVAMSCYLEHNQFKDSKILLDLMPLFISQILTVSKQNEELVNNHT